VSKHLLVFGHLIGLKMFPIVISTIRAVALGLVEPAYEFARTGVTR
jgi:hypothetical protein